MALSDEQRKFLVAGLANPSTAEEVEKILDEAEAAKALADSLKTTINALLDELEARRDAVQGIDSSTDGFYVGLKIA